MSQPKLPPDLAEELRHFGFVASCYQPVTLFKRQPPRTLPNVARDDDPWQVFLRRPDEIGVAVVAYGETLREALEEALFLRPGLSAAMIRLGAAVDDLTGGLQCR